MICGGCCIDDSMWLISMERVVMGHNEEGRFGGSLKKLERRL